VGACFSIRKRSPWIEAAFPPAATPPGRMVTMIAGL